MTNVVLDTNVLSELIRPKPQQRVVSYVRNLASPLISAMTVQEITFGLERATDPARKAKLAAWVASLRQEFRGKIIKVDWAIAERAAILRARAQATGRPYDIVDALIAACAVERGAVIATRNVKHFSHFGVDVINPWEERT